MLPVLTLSHLDTVQTLPALKAYPTSDRRAEELAGQEVVLNSEALHRERNVFAVEPQEMFGGAAVAGTYFVPGGFAGFMRMLLVTSSKRDSHCSQSTALI